MTARRAIELEACDECGHHHTIDRLATIWEAGEFKLMCESCIDELRVRLLEASSALGKAIDV